MKRFLCFFALLLFLVLTACNGVQSSLTTSTTDTLTTVEKITTVTTPVQTIVGGQAHRTSEWERLTTSKPVDDGKQLLMDKNIPWAKPVVTPFYAEVYTARAAATETFFTTEDYEFRRSYMADTRFVLDDGRVYQKKDLQMLVDEGTVTPEQLMAVFSLAAYPKQAVDTITGDKREGEMLSFQIYREATVQQGESRIHIYPPYDLVGNFSDDTQKPNWYFNAAYLRQLAESACSGRSFAMLTQADGIRVGNSLFIAEAVVEQYGISAEVVVPDEFDVYGMHSLRLILPEE